MPQPNTFYIRGRLGLKGWVVVFVALTLVLAIAIAIAVVAVGVFLFLLPAIVIAAALYYLFWRVKFPRRRYGARQPTIIDGEFRSVDSPDLQSNPREDETRPN